MSRDLFNYFTAFLCGASIMAVELAATRLLAPYYGASMVIWTIVIGVMLAAISIGNIAGGILADRAGQASPDTFPDKAGIESISEQDAIIIQTKVSQYASRILLFKAIWLASVWIALIPLVGKYIVASSFFLMMWLFPGNVLAAGTIFSCVTCFAPPCLVLGAVTPCLVKSNTVDLANNGRIAGELYALSTIGSIVGTFLPTFWTIPLLGTARTFYLFAFVLNLLATIFFLRERLHGKRAIISMLIIAALLTLVPADRSFAFWKKPILEDESIYNYLQVDRLDGNLFLSTHVEANRQSVMTDEHGLAGGYWDYTLIAPLWRRSWKSCEQPFRALVLGLGTGTFAKQCRHFFKNSIIDGVDIDQRIVDLARSHFGLRNEDANVFVEDARSFLAAASDTSRPYDLIFLDTYRDLTLPFHLTTREFFELVHHRLADDGVLVINVNLRSEGDDLSEYIVQTVKSVFPCVFRCNLPDQCNVMVYATSLTGGLATFDAHIRKLSKEIPLSWIACEARPLVREVTESRLVLTDDLAPVEMLGEKILDGMVHDGLREILVRLIGNS
ncbi:MAG: fused MFS/spermidine synthase [Candidatus Riflebacteria bacterium]|nr:fused MFS/spermidine synthase [Candidatus Riflebacteria bacterium]